MRNRRLFVIAFVVVTTSLGIPTQAFAAPSIPRSLTAVRTVASQVSPGETKRVSVSMPWRANMLGVSYLDRARNPNGVLVSVRAREAGVLGSWQALDTSDTVGSSNEADPASKRVATDPIWLATADRGQVEIAVPSGGQAIRDGRV